MGYCICVLSVTLESEARGYRRTEFWYWFKDKMEELLLNYNMNCIHDIYFFGHNNLNKLLSVCVPVCDYSVVEVGRGC